MGDLDFNKLNQQAQNKANDVRQDMMKQILLHLGGGMVEVELDPEHLEHALDVALERYRQRSSNSVEESHAFMELQPDQNEYVLPGEVMEVRQIFRRGVGGQATGGGTYLDPFAMAYTNLYLLQAGRQGGLATFDFFHQYQEVVGRMFGRDIEFKFNPANHTLSIFRAPNFPEQVALWLYNYKPDEVILTDTYSRPWVRDYAIAQSKLMLGAAYTKFASIIGPGGGTSLGGDAMKTEAQTEMERLEQELLNYSDGSDPLTFVIG